MGKIRSFFSALARFIGADDDPDEPIYDPIHLAAVLIGSLAALGLLYWLLWTLLVYDGGLFSKIGPLAHILSGSKTLADYGYRGSPYQMGAFRGWTGNLGALIISLVVIVFLHRRYRDAAEKAK